MSRYIKLAALPAAAAVMAAALTGCSLLPREEEALKPPLVKPAQENYHTVKVTRADIAKRITGTGFLESVATDVAQFTGQGGRIESILVKSGDSVKKGDVLVQLIMDDLDLRLKEQELALEKAKLAYRQAGDGGGDELRIARLQLDIEQIKYDRLKQQLDSRQLKAQMDGQVVFVENLQEGDFVEPYQTLVIVADPSRLRVTLRADNPDNIRDAEVGMAAEITVEGTQLEGKVVQTPRSAPATLNKDLAEQYARTLYIDVPNIPDDAEIGATVSVSIITQMKEDVLQIPRSGLRAFLGRSFVRVLEEGNRIREIDVEQGITTQTAVEIVSGLEEGQDVILQ